MGETLIFFGVCVALYFLLSWVPNGQIWQTTEPPVSQSPELDAIEKRSERVSAIKQLALNYIYWANVNDDRSLDIIKNFSIRYTGGWWCLKDSKEKMQESYSKLGLLGLYLQAESYISEFGMPLFFDGDEVKIIKSGGLIAEDIAK